MGTKTEIKEGIDKKKSDKQPKKKNKYTKPDIQTYTMDKKVSLLLMSGGHQPGGGQGMDSSGDAVTSTKESFNETQLESNIFKENPYEN